MSKFDEVIGKRKEELTEEEIFRQYELREM